MTRRRDIPCPREPIGLSAEESAAYLGMSQTLFFALIEKGAMPRARCAGRRRLWDALELSAAFRALPRDLPEGSNSGQDELDEPGDVWSRVRA